MNNIYAKNQKKANIITIRTLIASPRTQSNSLEDWCYYVADANIFATEPVSRYPVNRNTPSIGLIKLDIHRMEFFLVNAMIAMAHHRELYNHRT